MNYTIRPYTEDDLTGVISCWEQASAVAHPFLSEEFLKTERHNIPQLYLPMADTWVADRDGRVIGFISLLGNEVGAIFVEPEFHGIGVGTALMNKAQQLHGDLEVEVFAANTIGRRFYGRYGFEFLHETTHEDTGNLILRLKYTAH